MQKPILQKANSETQADNIFDETKKQKKNTEIPFQKVIL